MAKVRNICSFAKSFYEKFLMPMDVRIEKSWKDRLQNEFDKPYFEQLTDFVRREYRMSTVYPPGNQMFRAFDICPFDKVKVVILGQDPYHEPRQAHGLCFSVNDGIPFPPSLLNIFKEIESDLGIPMPKSGDLTRWADQGVLLLNATLTVRAHQAALIRIRVGSSLRMPLFIDWQKSENTLSLFCGDHMHNVKGILSIVRSIWF